MNIVLTVKYVKRYVMASARSWIRELEAAIKEESEHDFGTDNPGANQLCPVAPIADTAATLFMIDCLNSIRRLPRIVQRRPARAANEVDGDADDCRSTILHQWHRGSAARKQLGAAACRYGVKAAELRHRRNRVDDYAAKRV